MTTEEIVNFFIMEDEQEKQERKKRLFNKKLSQSIMIKEMFGYTDEKLIKIFLGVNDTMANILIDKMLK